MSGLFCKLFFVVSGLMRMVNEMIPSRGQIVQELRNLKQAIIVCESSKSRAEFRIKDITRKNEVQGK